MGCGVQTRNGAASLPCSLRSCGRERSVIRSHDGVTGTSSPVAEDRVDEKVLSENGGLHCSIELAARQARGIHC